MGSLEEPESLREVGLQLRHINTNIEQIKGTMREFNFVDTMSYEVFKEHINARFTALENNVETIKTEVDGGVRNRYNNIIGGVILLVIGMAVGVFTKVLGL